MSDSASTKPHRVSPGARALFVAAAAGSLVLLLGSAALLVALHIHDGEADFD